MIIISMLFASGCGFSKKHKDGDYNLDNPAQTKMKFRVTYSPSRYGEIIIWGNGQTECKSQDFELTRSWCGTNKHQINKFRTKVKKHKIFKTQFTLTQDEVLLFLDHFRKLKFFSMRKVKPEEGNIIPCTYLSLQVGQNFRERNLSVRDFNNVAMNDLLSLFFKTFEQEFAIRSLQEEKFDEITEINWSKVFNLNRIKPVLLKTIGSDNNQIKLICVNLAFELPEFCLS